MTLQGKWILDPAHSVAGFTARHAGIAKVRGKFDEVSASVDATVTPWQVEATIEAASFNSGNADRDSHVKSADFLDVEVFPTLFFKGEADESELRGDITIHGVTKPIVFELELSEEVVDPFDNIRVGGEATATISRKEFGLTWNAALEAGGVLVSDKVKLELDVSFIKEVAVVQEDGSL